MSYSVLFTSYRLICTFLCHTGYSFGRVLGLSILDKRLSHLLEDWRLEINYCSTHLINQFILFRTSKGGNGGYRDDVESMEDEGSGRDRDRDMDMEGRYGALYEQRMNPFEEVSRVRRNTYDET